MSHPAAGAACGLPSVTAELPGVGGALKRHPDHFVVEEVPLYEPSGAGEHVYVRIVRSGWTSDGLARALARLFDLDARAVGYAGRKDKHARVTQTFSLPLRALDPGEAAARIAGELPVEVLDARRHANKLRRGHLLANRFQVLLAEPGPDPRTALERALAVCAAIDARGLANYFGPQRFGSDGCNAGRGRELLARRPRSELERLWLSAWQSQLFNAWLARRIERGWFAELLAGDVAKTSDRGGLFTVEDLARERPRFERREIGYTGPIYGARMRAAEGVPGELERELLAEQDVAHSALATARLAGSRRPARVFPKDLRVLPEPSGLRFAFELAKGAYATTLLAEVQKLPGAGAGAALDEDDA